MYLTIRFTTIFYGNKLQNLSTKWLYTLFYFEGKKLSHFMDKFYNKWVDKEMWKNYQHPKCKP